MDGAGRRRTGACGLRILRLRVEPLVARRRRRGHLEFGRSVPIRQPHTDRRRHDRRAREWKHEHRSVGEDGCQAARIARCEFAKRDGRAHTRPQHNDAMARHHRGRERRLGHECRHRAVLAAPRPQRQHVFYAQIRRRRDVDAVALDHARAARHAVCGPCRHLAQ